MKKAVIIALCAVFLIYLSACSTKSNTPPVEISPAVLAVPASPSPKPAPDSVAEQPVARYAGSYIARDKAGAIAIDQRILITLFSGHAIVNEFEARGNRSYCREYAVRRNGDEIVFSRQESGWETESLRTSKIIIHPADGDAEPWADFNGIALDGNDREAREINLIDLGEPAKQTQTKFADYAGWQTEYAGVGGLVGIFSLTPTTQGIPVCDYYAVYKPSGISDTELVQPFWGMLFPPENGSIHIGYPISWQGVSANATQLWDRFFALNPDPKTVGSGLFENSAEHKGYFRNVTITRLEKALAHADTDEERASYGGLLTAANGIVNSDFPGGNEEEVRQYIFEHTERPPALNISDFKPFEMPPETWMAFLGDADYGYERYEMFRQFNIYLGDSPACDIPYLKDLGAREGSGIKDCVVYTDSEKFLFSQKPGEPWIMVHYDGLSASNGQFERVLLSNGDSTQTALLYFCYTPGHGTGYRQDVAYWYNLDSGEVILSNFGYGYSEDFDMPFLGDAAESVSFSYDTNDEQTQLILHYQYFASYRTYNPQTEYKPMFSAGRDVILSWDGKRFRADDGAPFPELWAVKDVVKLWLSDACQISREMLKREFKKELLEAAKSEDEYIRAWAKEILS